MKGIGFNLLAITPRNGTSSDESSFLDKEIKQLERFLFITNKSSSGPMGNKQDHSALKKISNMMKYSNNMENNIQDLNIKRVLEQEFAEKSMQVVSFSDADNRIHDRFGSLLKKRDAEFIKRIVKKKKQIKDN
jgi:hypothetical protein